MLSPNLARFGCLTLPEEDTMSDRMVPLSTSLVFCASFPLIAGILAVASVCNAQSTHAPGRQAAVVFAVPREMQDGVVHGLSGRDLRVDPSWQGRVRVALIVAEDVLPAAVLKQLRRDRQSSFERVTRERLRVLAKRNTGSGISETSETHHDSSRQRMESKRRYAMYQQAVAEHHDYGPIFDCVVSPNSASTILVDTDTDASLLDELPIRLQDESSAIHDSASSLKLIPSYRRSGGWSFRVDDSHGAADGDATSASPDSTGLVKNAFPPRSRELRQLQQTLSDLDDIGTRKQHLGRVVSAADNFIGAIEQLPPEERQVGSQNFESLVDAIYRKGRALGYMELPDVLAHTPILDKAAHDAAFESNFQKLAGLVDVTEKRFVLLTIRRERRLQNSGRALELLERYINDQPPNYWYFKKRRDIYGELGWRMLRERAHEEILVRFPEKRLLQ